MTTLSEDLREARYVGQKYQIDETDDLIYIGSDFPDEYANSNYSARAHGTIGKAKANASQVIPELIKIATNITYKENSDDKHSKNAKFGWCRCTVRFTLPTCDDKGSVIGKNAFQGRMIIRFDEDGKKYLYDIIVIKKRNVVPRMSKSCTAQNHISLPIMLLKFMQIVKCQFCEIQVNKASFRDLRLVNEKQPSDFKVGKLLHNFYKNLKKGDFCMSVDYKCRAGRFIMNFPCVFNNFMR